MIDAISLFTGAGGMDLGFESAGAKIVLANEIDKTAAETYKLNHPNTETLVDNINNIFPRLKELKGTDLIFGGPPCQGFSVIGKMNLDDERSQLIWSFLKAVEVVKPKAFVMENVKALATINKWKDVREQFLARANELGYGYVPYIINAAEYGTPQKSNVIKLRKNEK